MNRNLLLLALAQGLFLTNNVTFIAINGLVGLSLAPLAWMATLPVMGYVVGGAISTGLVARSQARWGRQVAFQIGLVVALGSAALALAALYLHSFALLVGATVVAGYYNANGQLYRFAAAELATTPAVRNQAVSWVMAGGLIGAIAGPNLARYSRTLLGQTYAGAYLALMVVALVAAGVMALIRFAPFAPPAKAAAHGAGRPLREIMAQPLFLISAITAALGYGVMNLLMAATPLAMQTCGQPFENTALVLEWHVIGMFAPGFITGSLIKRFGALAVMAVGVVLNAACIAVALSGVELQQFVVALFLLGVGWNFLFTGSTALSLDAWRPEEKDRAQAALNFCVFATMACTSFASGALVTTGGWTWLNLGSLLPVAAIAGALFCLSRHQRVTPRAITKPLPP